MNFARLDLCQELVALTDWQGTEYLIKVANGHIIHTGGVVVGHVTWVPLYDAGYLLLKLPQPLIVLHRGGMWECGRADPATPNRPPYPYSWQQEDTPADALCKLCIELAKRRIITR